MSSIAKSDAELVRELRTGNQKSFEELISRYSEKAYHLASRMCRNQEDAEEVLQDVFVTVYRKIDGFQEKSSFSSWLYRITVNSALMKLRKRRQDRSVAMEDAIPDEEHSLVLKTDEAKNADRTTLRKQISLVLEAAIQELPDDYRPVFILRDVDGLTSKEVSKILGLSIPAVKSRLHRSRIMLRQHLADFYLEFRSDEAKAA